MHHAVDGVYLLRTKNLPPRRRGPRHEYDRAQRRVGRRNHRRDQSTLAVADERDARRIDLRSRVQIRHAGTNVVGKVLRRDRPRTDIRSVDSTIIETQHSDATPTERIRKLAKRAVPLERGRLFVAILRPGTRDRHHSRRAARRSCAWNRQRPTQPQSR